MVKHCITKEIAGAVVLKAHNRVLPHWENVALSDPSYFPLLVYEAISD